MSAGRGPIARLRRLPPAERRVVIEAVVLLSIATLVRRATPARCLRRLLTAAPPAGHRRCEVASPRIAALVDATGVGLPWTASCLDRALAARWILARRGVPAALVLGAATEPFVAHAWLELAGGGTEAPIHHVIWRHP